MSSEPNVMQRASQHCGSGLMCAVVMRCTIHAQRSTRVKPKAWGTGDVGS